MEAVSFADFCRSIAGTEMEEQVNTLHAAALALHTAAINRLPGQRDGNPRRGRTATGRQIPRRRDCTPGRCYSGVRLVSTSSAATSYSLRFSVWENRRRTLNA